MNPMPLLPAQPSSPPSTARKADGETGAVNGAGDAGGGQTFAELLASGVGPRSDGDLPTGSAASKHSSHTAAPKHPAHRRPSDDTDATAADVAAAGVQPAVSAAGAQTPRQQPAKSADGASRSVDAAHPNTGNVAAAPDAGKLDPRVAIGIVQLRPQPGTSAPELPATTGAAIAGAAEVDAGSLAGRLPATSGAAQPSSDFSKLMSHFGKPTAAPATILDQQESGTSPSSSQGAGHAVPDVASVSPIAQARQPLGTGVPSAAAQSSGQSVSGAAMHGPSRLTAASHTAGTLGEHATARPGSGHAAGEHSKPLTAPDVTAAPTAPPPAPAPQTGLLASGPSATPTTQTAAQPAATPPMPAPLHSQVAGTLLELRARGDGTHRVLLELHPADLGQVTVEVRMHAGTVSIDLGSTNPEARHSLTSALPQLRAELAGAGLGNASVSVGADSSGGSAPRDGDSRPAPALPTTSAADSSPGLSDSRPSDGPARVRNQSRLTGVDRWL